jgi:hypothetical protein
MVEPTHIQSGASPSLLDLFLTSTPSEVGFFTQIDLPTCRMHLDLIYGSMRFPFSGARVDSTLYCRDYSRVDSEQLVLNVESIDLITVYMTSSVDEQVMFFNHAILNLFEQSVPLRRGLRSHNVNLWFEIYILSKQLFIAIWLTGLCSGRYLP